MKPGRRVHLTEARMIIDGRVAVTARAWHIAIGDRPAPTHDRDPAAPPAGEWVHLACRTHLAGDGVGLAQADLFDPDGLIGEVA